MSSISGRAGLINPKSGKRTHAMPAIEAPSGLTLTALLLTGGLSRRMGRDKAALVIGGEPLWARQLRLLRALQPQELWVSARSRPDWAPPGLRVVLDAPPSRGPLSGLAAALREVRTSHLLLLAVDLPEMTVERLQKLWSMAEPGRGVIPLNENFVEPLCALYPAEARADAEAALAGADASMQGLAGVLLEKKLAWVCPLTPEERTVHRNANT